MNTISRSEFEKILAKLKPACKPENSSPDMPMSLTNQNRANDSLDAHEDQAGMQEDLTEGHITGSGGPVRKNAAETPQKLEAKAYNQKALNWFDELSLLNNDALSNPLFAAMSLNKAVLSNPFTAALGYGGTAAGLTAGAIGLKNYLRGRRLTEADKRRQRNQKILAGLAGGAVGLGLRKWGSFGTPVLGDPLTFIAMKLQDDTTMSTIEQQRMLEAVAQMSHTQQFGLAQLLTTVAGAGIGAVIAKFLMNMGIGGTIGGALLGGFFGSRAGRFPDNRPGTINNSVDFFGRPI